MCNRIQYLTGFARPFGRSCIETHTICLSQASDTIVDSLAGLSSAFLAVAAVDASWLQPLNSNLM